MTPKLVPTYNSKTLPPHQRLSFKGVNPGGMGVMYPPHVLTLKSVGFFVQEN